jgi:hypothetical protein
LSAPQCTIAHILAAALSLAIIATATAQAQTTETTSSESSPVAFNRDIMPILSNACFTCHGPDAPARKAGLRLDAREIAKSVLPSGKIAILPGDPSQSALVERIFSDDPDEQMPPPESGKDLSAHDRSRLVQWIAEGAPWEDHWAFIPPSKPPVPAVSHSVWPRNPIDNFVLARLEEEGLAPSAEADRNTLIRRLALDLTGLPPAPDEVTAFVDDDRPDAYARLVDRFLDSPRYGENMARYWLDLARYADTNGFAADIERTMWRYRDWVIDAFNANMPFDQFTIEQLAGDLLPEPTLEQRIATGFNRNHPIMMEGGAIFEEYRVGNVVDRAHTTATTWLGLTMKCAQCHDHKYDPITQQEFYGFYAFFNNVDENESRLFGTELDGNTPPRIKAPLPAQREEKKRLEVALKAMQSEMLRPIEDLDRLQEEWEVVGRAAVDSQWSPLNALPAPSEDEGVLELLSQSTLGRLTAIRLDILPATINTGEQEPVVLSELSAFVVPPSTEAEEVRITFTKSTARSTDASALIDGREEESWHPASMDKGGSAVLSVAVPVELSEGNKIRIVLKGGGLSTMAGRIQIRGSDDLSYLPAALGDWHVNGPHPAEDGDEAMVTEYVEPKHVDLASTDGDGNPRWIARPDDLTDGKAHRTEGKNCSTYFYRTITAPNPRTMDISLANRNAVRLWVNGRLTFDKKAQRGEVGAHPSPVSIQLREGENAILIKTVDYYDFNNPTFFFARRDEDVGRWPLNVENALHLMPADRSVGQSKNLRAYYRSRYWDGWATLDAERHDIAWDLGILEKEIPTTMVMADRAEPRETMVLIRGEYDQPSAPVSSGVPSALHTWPKDAPKNRLGLARWIVAPDNPLTARVAANRTWQHYFGTGLVKTADDFGIQGARPSHPELLDWLALRFIESGWDVKALQRLIVQSSTYRQHSRHRKDVVARDPDNILLARGPRYRLEAEQIRDNALAASGLLSNALGGPSVKPYQPAGLWRDVAYGGGGQRYTAQEYIQDHGEKLYRRSLYTFWKRAAAPPGMLLFDAPNRDICTAQRGRSNTPLQALALMNDIQYVEAARALASRVMKEGGATEDERIDYACLLVLARPPREIERDALQELYEAQRADFQQTPKAANALLKTGESIVAPNLDPPELAAWTVVASALMNTDAAVSQY